MTVYSILNKVFTQHSSEIALVTKDGIRMSFGQVRERASRLASLLGKKKIREGGLVAVLMDRDSDYLIAVATCLLYGYAFIPMDTEYPDERIKDIISDSHADFIIDNVVFAESAKEKTLADSERKEPNENSPAYAVYTSGSTGKPKGILHDQRSVAEALIRIADYEKLNSTDLWGVSSPFTFVAMVIEVPASWLAGVGVIVIPRNIVKDPELLSRYIEKNRITASFIPPRILKLFRKSGTTLRYVVTGGEKITDISPDGFRLSGCYGQSETCGPFTWVDIEEATTVSLIGRSVYGNRLYILDEDGREAEEGEICFTGHFMTCYINMPEETASALTENPFKEKDGQDYLIHTGDIGRKLYNGDVVFLNRKDWMIKINGQRVEPGEIENVLRHTDCVSDAAVKSFVNRYGQTYMCAYYTCRQKISGDRLKSVIAKRLPSYMVPSFFVQLDEMPLNNNKKLDRNALKEPDATSFLTQYVQPSTETESLICRAFSNILGIPGIGVLDDFFRLGGDSIKAVMVAKECAGLGLSVKQIFCGKTPEKIAALVSSQTENEEIVLQETDVMPLTDSQMGIYLDSCNDEPDCRYNIPFVLSFPNNLVDATTLKDALVKVLKSHQVFSLDITVDQGTPVMRKNSSVIPDIAVTEASEEEYTKIKASFVKPFHVGKECLFRALIVKTSSCINLLFDIHHVIFDGTSLRVFCEDLCNACCGNEIEKESITPFMVSASEKLQSEKQEYTECLEYYRNLLSGNETDSNIIPDLDSPDLHDRKGIYEISLDIDSRSAEFFTGNVGITENTLFVSAFAYALAKFTCQTSSLFVCVENGRPEVAMDRSVGMFVRSFPVLVSIEDESRTEDYLTDVQNRFFDSMVHDSVSFADVANACGIDSGVKFVYQADMLNGFDFRGARINIGNLDVNETMSNLDIMVLKQNGSYKISIGYRASMYSQALIESFAITFNNIVNGLTRCEYLREIRLTDEKQETLLDSFNNTECEYNYSESTVDMFRKTAEKYPDNDAVIFSGIKLSYREFDRLTDNIAACIVSNNIKPDSFVPVLVSRTILMPVLSFGVIKAGCAYQPLDPAYPADRLNFMVKDSGADFLISERELYPLIKDFKGKVLFTDEIDSLPDRTVNVSVTPESRAALLYTSGTTGIPKGVVIKHKNIVNLVFNHVINMDMTPSSHYATYASFGFDAFIMDQFSSLCTGCALYIIPEQIRLDLKALVKFYDDNRITHGFVTTQLGCMLAREIKTEGFRTLMLGGEKIIPFTPSDKFSVLNGYGPSECVAYVTQFRVKDNSTIQPIGKACRNTRLYITDKYMRRLPCGACGELIIASVQVSDGYLNRPEKTQEVFIANPFSKERNYDRAYRTGDITRYLPDGNVEFIGRRDGQVKIRGFRIELTEVEQVIRAFDGITNATVQAYDYQGGGKFIAAFVTSDSNVDINRLNAFIESQKPSYMVPAVTMQLDAIPLNQNGKVDRKKLPKPEIKAEEIVQPETDLQIEILEIVKSVLGTEQIGITSDIYKCGLTSLGTIRLNSLLSEKYDVAIQTVDLKENSTVGKLESLILQRKNTVQVKETPAVVYPDYPITKTQEGILIECVGNPDSTVYNIPYLIRISSEIDIRRLRIAICEAVEAHSSINTTLFYDKNGNVRQKPASAGVFTSECIEEISADSIDEIKSVLVRPFDLIGGRLYRIAIVRAGDTYLFLDFHHIISDGTSMVIFLHDIEEAYMGRSPKEEKYSGPDIALNEQKARNSHFYLDAEDYYDNLLSGVDAVSLPHSDMHSYAVKGCGRLIVTGENGTVKKVNNYCINNNVSVNAVLCTVFGKVLSAYNGTDSSLFTTVYNGRNDSRMTRTVSMLVKTLPVLFNPEHEDVLSCVKSMSQQLVNSMTNDIYSFAEISRKFSVKADVMFIYQGQGFEQTSFCGRNCSVVPLGLSDNKAPVCIQVEEHDGCYRYTVECDPSLYTDDFGYSLAHSFDYAVSQIPDVAYLGDISLADKQSIDLMDRINITETSYDRSKTAVDYLKHHTEASPDRVAVSFKDKVLTYREFDRVTDNLASYLLELGAVKNDFIAILTDRNETAVEAAWGIVKAGCAYLPIDPAYPKDRISLMLSDSRTRIIITQRDKSGLYEGYDGKVIFTDEIESLPDRNTGVIINEEDPFILVYSSGSSGVPKGSMLPHRSLSALAENTHIACGVEQGSRIACYASFGFDAGLMDIFCTLMNGGTLLIIPEEIRLDIQAMDKFFIDNKITHSFMTTQVARTFILNTKCKTLKCFLFGGEKMIPFNPPKDFKVYNGYGPSETNCYVTLYRISDDRNVQPIGKQSVNTKLYVLDKAGRRLPPYACGELCIAGPQVALGYLNRPEKNALSFVRNPFCDEKDYSVIYKTGDIVRMFSDGNYDFVGRRDGQVKIRGFRIELGEVEHSISSYPGIKQVTVQAFDNPDGGKFLAAYYVADDETDPEKVADFIRKSKPDYMVPSFMTQIDSIPLTANGKVNKAKLPQAKPAQRKEGSLPVGETETRLCELFASVLNADKVYADDNFFDMGGTSITALQLVVKCVNAGFMVVYKNLFENPTPRLLAKHINGELEVHDVFAPSGEEAEKYDYSALNYNVPENLPEIRNDGIGDVLLTGATGFLGIHVLRNLLDTTDAKIFCLVRSKDGISVKDRLELLATYYFEDDFSSFIGSRIVLIDGDLSDGNLSDKIGSCRFDTILNCAANVHHFGSEEALMRDNFNGIRTLIDIAKSRNAKLVQASSISVCGESVNGSIPPDFVFRENNLNIGQSLENMYVRTKYLAEQEIINAISRGEIRGKIVRFGNLMARSADGEFQINSSNNGFLNMINGFRILGCYPVDALDAGIEFSPIDYAAKALVLLAGTPDEFTVFHASSAYNVHFANILNIMNSLGFEINYTDPEKFAVHLAQVSADESLASKLSGILSYMNNVNGDISSIVRRSSDSLKEFDTRIKVKSSNSYTVKALYRLGFTWPLTDNEYLTSLVRNLKELDFFK